MSYSIRIERGIPLPDKRRLCYDRRSESHAHPLSWVLKKLNVGDSFIYPPSTCESFSSLRSITSHYAKRWDFKFATRAVKHRDGVEALRIWRTK